MRRLGTFKQYWDNVRQTIGKIVQRRGARAYMPDVSGAELVGEDGRYEITFDGPAFFYNAPQKGSSKKSGQSHRQAIFVDGKFIVKEEEGRVSLIEGACNVSVYDTELGDTYKLTLVEAMHFDMENEIQSEFHPMFHVQRGTSKTLTTEMIVNKAALATHLPPEKILISDTSSVGLSYMRLPTPQMDYFSVLATVVADFFCSEGQSDRTTKDEFRQLLRSMLSNKNLMRDGASSQVLRKRWNDDLPFGAQHWYRESV